MKKYFFVFILIITIGCNYINDKLIVQNNTDKEIWFVVMYKNRLDNKFYYTQIQSLVYPNESTSAILQVVGTNNKNCEEILNNQLYDNKIYVAFFNPNVTGPIENLNPNVIFDNEKIKVKIYTKNDLDNLGWVVNYNER